MGKDAAEVGYAVYWRTWGFLLVLTLVMVVLDQAAVPRVVLVLVLLTAMLVKAVLIAGTFMHLNQERLSLALTVAIALLATGAVLFFLIAPDGLRLLHMRN
jgi:cytochrome c oxidase subunit IV